MLVLIRMLMWGQAPSASVERSSTVVDTEALATSATREYS
jgi:hypothetical protein